ncbi:MAG: class I SAM-dependent methyltransferase [Ilumatobacteraceae bacterium]
MLTIRFDQLGVQPGDAVLDAGAGFGRHAFALAREGANVVALDYAAGEVAATRATFAAMAEAGEIAEQRFVGGLQGDATCLPFADSSFDRVITSEVLEHIQSDTAAISEFVRVLKPGGTFAATVPAWLPEKINWMLSDEYHAPKSVGGHVRIYTATELKAKLRSAGLDITGSHHAHALHSPYWWLKCAVGVRRDDNRAVQAYQRMLEWEITEQPRAMKILDRAASPLLGKSFIVYARKAQDHAAAA